uniref:Myelin regulatory factor n=1 Tax=Caenorhabditis japonica TaxID=281687 RepID=A0A8R1HWK5_CAEJA
MSNSGLIKGEYDLSNAENFNIIQFLRDTDADYATEDDGSMVSPTSSADSMHNQNNNNRGGPPQHMQHGGRGNHPNVSSHNAIFQTRRLPDSPPMTDASSSSHQSDPMFSPNEFNNYNGANPNMLLGVHDLQQNMGQPPRVNVNGNLNGNNNSLIAQQLQQQNPQFWNNGQTQSQKVSPYSGTMENLYNMLQGNDNGLASPVLDEPSNRKRSRMDTPCETPRNFSSNMAIDAFGDENYNHQQAIKFAKFQEEAWNCLYDVNGRELQQLQVHVVADKGFNYSNIDNCFVNQKKNHFQVSVHVEASDSMPPKYVSCNNSLIPIKDFRLKFCGVKSEMPTSEVCIRQSRADRKPHPHTPVLFEIQERRMTKVTVPRLHFSETTLNNQRKNFRPNPEQKYFLLVVQLYASISDDVNVLIQSYASEKVIVRATNPGSFEPPDSDVAWQRSGGTLHTPGAVAIGTDRTVESARLTVAGDIYMSGRIINPSDIRLKEGITEKEAAEAVENLLKLRVVDYRYKPEVADMWGLDEQQRQRTGLIAQELAAVLPDAVRDIGDYFTIDESRVFYETVMATQQLCRMNGDLDNKIDEKVAEINRRLSEYARRKKLASSMGSNLNGDNKSLSFSRCSLTSTATNMTSQPKKRDNKKRNQQSTSCTSKLSQGTVVTLVSIMAACLLAMSSLYILDWHNRNYGYHQHFDVNTQSTKGEPANLVVSPSDYMPLFQPDAPILLNKCFNPSCKTYCCADVPPVPEDSVNIATDGFHNGEESADRPAVNKTARAPNVEHKSFDTGVQIRVPALNETIDQRYCIERSCNFKKGIYNLYIPVSKYMPDVALEVEINAPITKVIANCGAHPEFNHKVCPLSRHSVSQFPTSTRIFDNLFELSMGTYIQSAYRFRIGYSTESCSSDEANGLYEEYNLIFYRTCTLSSS